MSSTPPSTPDQPEYLDLGSGGPIPPETAAAGSGRGRRKGLLVGGGVAALAVVGVGAWAAVSFFGTGPQPAEALPAGTLGYVAVDLDPSGGQKIEALQTLNKFPAFEDEIGIDTDDDIRKALFEEIQSELDCESLDYEADVEPWLGDRAAVAAVDVGEETPSPVFVLQVKDADKAGDGIAALEDCAGEEVGASIDGDWAVIAETDAIAEKVSDQAAKGSLAEDEDFTRWTEEAGDSGIVTMYAGPALGDWLAENADDVFGFPLGMVTGMAASTDCLSVMDDEGNLAEDDSCLDGAMPGMGESLVSDELKEKMSDFQGMAGIVRFDDGAFELEFAADSNAAGSSLLEGDGAGDTISSLPDDTAAAVGIGFAEGWFRDVLDVYAPYLGGGADLDTLLDDLETETGLTVPEDIETLFGDSAALAIGSDFDPEAFFESADGSDIPIALKVDGDPQEVEAVLEKLRGQFAADEIAVFGSDSEGDSIVIGPNEDYRQEVLEDGDLGDDDVFKDVVREADDAAMVLFVNVDEIEKAIAEALGETDDDEFFDNLKPISGFGVSAWTDDGVAHSVARLTTD